MLLITAQPVPVLEHMSIGWTLSLHTETLLLVHCGFDGGGRLPAAMFTCAW
jgi:hypothetical protein